MTEKTKKLFVKFSYNMETGKALVMDTNVKDHRIHDFLTDYLHTQIGAGEDSTPAIERKRYEITISCDLSEDIWSATYNCGNAGLLVGMVQDLHKQFSPRYHPHLWFC